MQEELELIFPTEEYKEEIIDFKEEFKKDRKSTRLNSSHNA